MVSKISVVTSSALICVVSTLTVILCGSSNLISTDSKTPASPNKPSFGYILNGVVHGCGDEDACWIEKVIAKKGMGEVVRTSPSGRWFVSVPKAAWARLATDESLIHIHVSQDPPVELVGLRFLRFVGKNHFTVSDRNHAVYLVGPGEDKRRVRSSKLTISDSGRIASVLDSKKVGTWNSLDNYFRGDEPSSIEQDNHPVVSLQWFDDVLVVERGLGRDSDNSVAFRFPNHEDDFVLSRHSVLSEGTACLVSVFDHNRGVYKRPLRGEEGIVWQDVNLPNGISMSSMSPDGRFVLVAKHPLWPPGAWPVSSLRATDEPKKVIQTLGNGNVFQGWVRCNCNPIQ